jgi:hypothetical protein
MPVLFTLGPFAKHAHKWCTATKVTAACTTGCRNWYMSQHARLQNRLNATIPPGVVKQAWCWPRGARSRSQRTCCPGWPIRKSAESCGAGMMQCRPSYEPLSRPNPASTLQHVCDHVTKQCKCWLMSSHARASGPHAGRAKKNGLLDRAASAPQEALTWLGRGEERYTSRALPQACARACPTFAACMPAAPPPMCTPHDTSPMGSDPGHKLTAPRNAAK